MGKRGLLAGSDDASMEPCDMTGERALTRAQGWRLLYRYQTIHGGQNVAWRPKPNVAAFWCNVFRDTYAWGAWINPRLAGQAWCPLSSRPRDS